jgi:DNA-binding transcriptional MerR regulator
MSQKDGYINKEVASLIGMKPSSVAYYTNKGFVTPEVANPKGRGTTRKYSKKNLAEFLLIRKLSEFGFSLEKIRMILKKIGEYEHHGVELRPIPILTEDIKMLSDEYFTVWRGATIKLVIIDPIEFEDDFPVGIILTLDGRWIDDKLAGQDYDHDLKIELEKVVSEINLGTRGFYMMGFNDAVIIDITKIMEQVANI